MASDPSIDWQELVREAVSFIIPLAGWFGGKFLFNHWEKRQKDIANEKSEQEVAVEAGEAVATFAKVARDTGDFNVNLRKELKEMRVEIYALRDRVYVLEREKTNMTDRNQKLENRVKILEETLRANNIPVPGNGV